LLDQPRTRFDVGGVLGDFLGDAWHFYQAPRKHVLVASEEVDELTFLFRVQIGPNRSARFWQGLGLMLRVCSATSLPGDTWHFYQDPWKHVLVALEEVDEPTFLFRVQIGPDRSAQFWQGLWQ
jgi:hypothetical protein